MNLMDLSADQWIDILLSLGIVFGTAVLARILFSYVLDRIFRRVIRPLDDSLGLSIVRGLRFPLSLTAILIALQVAILRLDFLLEEDWYLPIDNAFFILYFLAAYSLTWRLISGLLEWYGEVMAPKTDTELDEQLVPFIRRIGLIVLTLIGLIILLGRFDIDVSGLVATLGIGSLAIALAAQESLSDAISGFMIIFDRPFRIGDRIEIQDLGTWGDVMDIGLRSTRIRTRDNRMVIVPNSVMVKSLIVNYSYPDTQYRIEIELGIAYGTDIEMARKIMVEAVRSVEGVLQDKPVEALFLQFGDSAMIFRLRWWLESYEDTRRMFDRVNTKVYKAVEEAGIELPYPQIEIRHR